MTDTSNHNETGTYTGLETAVTGMAARFPGAPDVYTFWENLVDGVESIKFFTPQELEDAGMDPQLTRDPGFVNARGFVEGSEYFDASFFGYLPGEARIMDPQVRVFHECVWEALENAGIDPSRFEGLIGLYAGAGPGMLWQAYSLMASADSSIDSFAAGQLRDKSFLTTNISYRLNLRGPSITFYSACSTSLAAVHMATQALVNGECDIALAGGVSLGEPYARGYRYQEGMINSPDGHCRAFDARAAGTVSGMGAGAVVLKPLDSAMEDDDHIYAVVKGSSINNDGIRKVGFAAPSAEGQAEAIQNALAAAEVEPESISYIETHGTGTSMGDPIEIEALNLVFGERTEKNCALGALKTNVGHMDCAAGVAGLIKAVLALKHRQIPPTLHFNTPNPKIDFENSPFYVNTELSPWENNDYPLRAGVSSFGIGGTNAHVILEEAPQLESSPSNREVHLLLLSAKTAGALERMTAAFGQFLRQRPGLSIADAAYTLKTGRQEFPRRLSVTCRTTAEAAEIFSTPGSEQIKLGVAGKEKHSVVFMFPGQGAQYINMGRELYQKEKNFRDTADRCFAIAAQLGRNDLKGLLYPVDNNNVDNNNNEQHPVNRTGNTQPLLFIFEYALASLLIQWGIQPDIMTGHSIGEYTAACLSGVLELEDAIRLVILRGKLMESLPPGSMLSVPMEQTELEPLLENYRLESNANLSLAAVNAPGVCVVSGETREIESFGAMLGTKGYKCRTLHTSHAFHSPMMEPILDQFRAAVEKIPRKEPGIPYISNLTGDTVTKEDIQDPGYWSRHLRRGVMFSKGIQTLLKQKRRRFVFIEAGPGHTLGTFVRRHIDTKSPHKTVTLVRHPREHVHDLEFLTGKIGELWRCGVTPDWQAFYGEEQRRKIPLPTYPFEKISYPVGQDPFKMVAEMSGISAIERKPAVADWFYTPTWKRFPLPSAPLARTTGQDAPGPWLVFTGQHAVSTALLERLQSLTGGGPVITVTPGPGCQKVSPSAYTVEPGSPGDFEQLIQSLVRGGHTPANILHLWNTGPGNNETGKQNNIDTNIDTVDQILATGFYSLTALARAIGIHMPSAPVRLIAVTGNMQDVTGAEALCPANSTIIGAIKVIPQEYRNITCRSIDIDNRQDAGYVSQLILDECLHPSEHPFIAYREAYCWVPGFEPVPLHPGQPGASLLRENAVYLVTGGFGGMGLAVARHLAGTYRARLVLTGRSPLNQERRDLLRELETAGAQVIYHAADIADAEAVEQAVLDAEARFGPLNGIIHTAGIPDFAGSIHERTRETNEAVFSAKIRGTLSLDRIAAARDLDFIALCSSFSAVDAHFGEVGYASANAFMDAFAVYRNRRKGTPGTPAPRPFTVSIGWCGWKETGMAIESVKKRGGDVEKDLWHGVTSREGLEIFERALSHRHSYLAVSTVDADLLLASRQAPEPEAVAEEDKIVSVERPDISTAYVEPATEAQVQLAAVWQGFFGIGQIGINDNFFELGGDSLKAMTLSSRIHRRLDVDIPLPQFFARPTIKEMADLIDTSEKRVSDTIPLAEKADSYPLSPAQRRMFIVREFEDKDTGTGYNMPQVIPVEKSTAREMEKLMETFMALFQRHESLRTSFHMIGGEPVQCVHPVEDLTFRIESYYTRSRQEIQDAVSRFVRPFDLSLFPLVRAALITTGDVYDYDFIAVDMHHIMSDGMSIDLLARDFKSLYSGEPLPPLPIQYKDYAVWLTREDRSAGLQAQRDYWINQFPHEIPVLDLPVDFPRPAVQQFDGRSIEMLLDNTQAAGLKEIAAQLDGTLYAVLLGVLNILLAKLSGGDDIVIGTAAAGRRHADLENVIGMFVGTLPMRNRPEPGKTIRSFLSEVKEHSLQAFQNQEFPFEELVDALDIPRDAGRNPLFDVMFTLQNTSEPQVYGRRVDSENGNGGQQLTLHAVAKFDLTFIIAEAVNGLIVQIDYAEALFKNETAKRFLGFLKRVVSHIINHPGDTISQISLMDENELETVLYEFNKTEADYPRDKTIIHLFNDTVKKCPDAAALVETGPHHVTYRELDRQSGVLAARLTKQGVVPGTIVALVGKRSAGIVTGMMGIMKTGAAYLPVDHAMPLERIRYIMADGNTRFVVSNVDCSRILEGRDAVEIKMADVLEEARDYGKDIKEDKREDRKETCPCEPEGIAYVIYTSGTTGKPKGTLIPHRAMMNMLAWAKRFYQLTPKDRSSQYASVTFDASIIEIYPALADGLEVHIIDDALRLDIPGLKHYFNTRHITFTFLPTQMGTQFMDDEQEIPYFRQIQVGGEKLNRFVKRDYIFYNIYGPTENTVLSTVYHVTENMPNIPIGKPNDNIRAYILDPVTLAPQPIGISGELCLAGENLALGYLNRPELTAEKFVGDEHGFLSGDGHGFFRHGLHGLPRMSTEGFDLKRKLEASGKELVSAPASYELPATSCLYRTGDLVRWLPDGNIEFLGRIDEQVQIRGYRVELGEVTRQLMAVDSVSDAVVVELKEEKGGNFLCGYYVSDTELDHDYIKEKMSRFLQDYMIPAFFHRMDRLPLSSTGKVNKRKLPMPAVKSDKPFTAPSTPVEITLAGIWAGVLNMEPREIGIDDNFFHLGGHSLKATTVASAVHKALDVQVPLGLFFQFPTIRELGKYIEEAAAEEFSAIEPAPVQEHYPVTPAQERMYVLRQIDPGGITYNITQVIPLGGPDDAPDGDAPDIEKLERVFGQLIHRHESFRTSFHTRNEETVQVIHDTVSFQIQYFNTGSGQWEASASPRLQPVSCDIALAARRFVKPFDLGVPPLLRAGLIHIARHGYFLISDMHHIISDGTSMEVLTRDFSALYNGEELPPLRIQYKDFAVWRRDPKHLDAQKKREDYWLDRFKGDIPVLQLPLDFPRPPVFTFGGHEVKTVLSARQTRELNALAVQSGCTLYMVLIGALNILLHRLSGSDDIITGTAVAGRGHADLEPVIGMFINTLAIRSFPVPSKTITGFLSEVKQASLDGFENQDYPFEDLVEKVDARRDTSRNPLFDVMFTLQNMAEKGRSGDDVLDAAARFDLTFVAYESVDGLALHLQSCAALFSKETTARFLRFYQRIIDHIIEYPNHTISQIQLMDDREREQVLFDFNTTGAPYPGDKTICHLFRETVTKYPDAVALVEKGNHALSYRELDRCSDAVASQLNRIGVTTGDIAALAVERSAGAVAGMLGIMKAGGAFLPVDTAAPVERSRYILADSNTRCIVTNTDCSHILEGFDKAGQITEVNIDDAIEKSRGEVMVEDMGEDRLGTCPNGSLDLAYVIYTSGTTGRPKGTLIEHRALVNHSSWFSEYYRLTPGDRSAQCAVLTFDACICEIFPAISSGSQVHIVDDAVRIDIAALKHFYTTRGITVSFLSTQLASQFFEDHQATPYLRELLAGGEKLNRFVKRNYQLHNNYGPTENTVLSTVYKVNTQMPNIPIGKPNSNILAYILDPVTLNPQPIGIPGELCLAGHNLARGYLNRPELTAEKFILAHSSWLIARREKKETITTGSKEPSFPMSYELPATSCLYRTGDLVRWLPDGNIEFIGRIDEQVKVRGFRIELGEVTQRLLAVDGVSEAVVKALDDTDGGKYLCGYYTAGAEMDAAAIKDNMKTFLPDYMVPAYLIYMEKFPVTASGKIDTRALPLPELTGGEGYTAPASEIENALVKVWAEVLGVEPGVVGIDSGFFDLGGHSLKATRMLAVVHRDLGVKIPLVDVFNAPTIRELAQLIQQKETRKYEAVVPAPAADVYPVSVNQKRVWVLHSMVPDSAVWNMYTAAQLPGTLEEPVLRDIVQLLVRRHEGLRTGFKLLDGEPVQWVEETVDIPISTIDISHLPAEEKSARDADLTVQFVTTPFDLESVPLFRVHIIKLSQEMCRVWFVMHHIISDGWSMELLNRDFALAYQSVVNAEPFGLEPLTVQYKDFAVWQTNRLAEPGYIEKLTGYWKEHVRDGLPVLQLPRDFEEGGQYRQSAGYRFAVTGGTGDALHRIAETHNTGIYAVMLSILTMALSKASSQRDIVTGILGAGREQASLNDVVGFFVNTLVHANRLEPEQQYPRFLQDVNRRLMDMLEHQSIPLELVFEELGMKFPELPLMFDIFHAEAEEYAGDINPEPSHMTMVHDIKFDVIVRVIQMQDGIEVNCLYKRERFKTETIEFLMGNYIQMIETVAAQPDQHLGHFIVKKKKKLLSL